MYISRRQFIKYCSIAAGALGLNATDLMKIEKATAGPGGLPVLWIAGQACTGCTTSLANSVFYATIQDVLLFGVGPGGPTLDLKVCETLMAAMSNEATQQSPGITDSPFALVIEGAITTTPGYCQIGSYTGAASENMSDVVKMLATHSNCAKILPVGTCASFGGIPAATGNVTGAMGFLDFAKTLPQYQALKKKTINIPGCPPNPNWVVGTIAYLLVNGPTTTPPIDSLRRPRTYYGQRICNTCDRFATSLTGQDIGFVGVTSSNKMTVTEPNRIGDPTQNLPGGRCLKKAGCKGSKTKSDCSSLKWHSPNVGVAGVNWCVGAGAPCQGCTQNFFPDKMSPFHLIK